jgi:hypothetical protein
MEYFPPHWVPFSPYSLDLNTPIYSRALNYPLVKSKGLINLKWYMQVLRKKLFRRKGEEALDAKDSNYDLTLTDTGKLTKPSVIIGQIEALDKERADLLKQLKAMLA